MTADLRKVNALAAGWPWCEEHESPRWNGPDSCRHLHRDEHIPQTLDVAAPDLAAEDAWGIAGDPP